jgi:hypothetical protein
MKKGHCVETGIDVEEISKSNESKSNEGNV